MANKQLFFNDLPEIDDGWWKSVLAEDEEWKRSRPTAKGAGKLEKSGEGLSWEWANEIFRQDQIIRLVVTGFNKGGLLVDQDGMHGFIPLSHLVNLPQPLSKEERESCLSAYVGRTLNLKIIECVRDEGRLVLSERSALAEPGRRTHLFNTLQSGQNVNGVVTNITEFGVFVDMGGVEGLIHISELSWGRVRHPSQILQEGQEINVLVLKVFPERCRVALSLKRLGSNPWEKAANIYRKNQIVPAIVTSLTSFGAFACVEDGLEGLIHSSEIPLAPDTSSKIVLQPGKKIMARIIKIDISKQRMSLSLNLDSN
jgi:small subunit ribosomal protein S1